jgi:serine/threonine protein kinase
MERCNESLADRLGGGPLSLQEVLETTADILGGLKAIHARDIIHRDLKPANILRLRDRWILADFGMSLLGDEKSFITSQESLPGTIPYTAPEVIYPETVTCTADIFSLGVCLKEMFTTHTTRNKGPSALLLNGTDPKTKEEIGLFDNIVTNMTNLVEAMRPQTVDEVAAQLKSIFKSINSRRFHGDVLEGIDKLDI